MKKCKHDKTYSYFGWERCTKCHKYLFAYSTDRLRTEEELALYKDGSSTPYEGLREVR